MREKLSYYLEDHIFEVLDEAFSTAAGALLRQSKIIVESKGKTALENLFGNESLGVAEILTSDLTEDEKREKLLDKFKSEGEICLYFKDSHRLCIDPMYDLVELEVRDFDVFSICHGIMQALEDNGYAIWLDDCPEHPAEPEPKMLNKESLDFLANPSSTYF